MIPESGIRPPVDSYARTDTGLGSGISRRWALLAGRGTFQFRGSDWPEGSLDGILVQLGLDLVEVRKILASGPYRRSVRTRIKGRRHRGFRSGRNGTGGPDFVIMNQGRTDASARR